MFLVMREARVLVFYLLTVLFTGDEILETSHGRRSIDVLAILAPHLANGEYVCKAEGAIPINYGQDATEVPGSMYLIEEQFATGAWVCAWT